MHIKLSFISTFCLNDIRDIIRFRNVLHVFMMKTMNNCILLLNLSTIHDIHVHLQIANLHDLNMKSFLFFFFFFIQFNVPFKIISLISRQANR